MSDNFNLDDLLKYMIKVDASDLHLSVDSPPKMRIQGELKNVSQIIMEQERLENLLTDALSGNEEERFKKNRELDFMYVMDTDNGKERFRVNYFSQRNSVAAVFRHIPKEIKTLSELGIPEQVARVANLPRGLVLVTGPTGSGKSTTLATIIDLINNSRPVHIMTIEDPIEFVHDNKKALVNQRQVGTDTKDFQMALRQTLRQDPDVILVGELRDLETIKMALTAAETGHLVLATLHTQSAAQSIDRIVDVFPAEQQDQIKTQLASTLRGIVCQTLLPTPDGKSRVPAIEIMFMTPAIGNLIRTDKNYQIPSTLQSSRKEGMQTMDQSLANLVNNEKVEYRTALNVAQDKKGFNILVDNVYKN